MPATNTATKTPASNRTSQIGLVDAITQARKTKPTKSQMADTTNYTMAQRYEVSYSSELTGAARAIENGQWCEAEKSRRLAAGARRVEITFGTKPGTMMIFEWK